MPLTGKQVQQIQDALLDGYPTKEELAMMVRIKLEQNLAAIVSGDNLRVIIFNLVTWAEQTDRVGDLIQGACDYNPGNKALQQLGQEWRATLSSQPAGQPVAVPATSPPAGRVSIDLFLSYSRKDSDAMRQVQEQLRGVGLAVWTDQGLEPGTQSWQDAISEAVRQAGAMVVLLSPDSSQSKWVKNEIGFAQALDKRIFPVLIAGDPATAVPISLISAQWVDGRANLQQAVRQNLLPQLRGHLKLLEPRPGALPARQEAVVQQVAELPHGAASPGRIPGGKQRTSMYLWIPVAIVAGALGLFVMERYFFPPQPPALTSEAMNPTPTSAEAANVAEITEAAAMLEVSPAHPSTEVATPTPTATSTPEPTATWTRTPAPTATYTRMPVPTATHILTPAPGTTKTNPKDGAEYVYVPAGPFTMGSGEGDAMAYDNEKPQTTVNVDAFWIMRTEVTNEQYKRCVDDDGACTEPENERWNDPAYADHPVTNVTWQHAYDYAAWAGGRLPTEAEWEKACRGTDGQIYPWGDTKPTAELANFGLTVGNTTSVGTYSPQGDSPYGVADMAGNVWEWTSSQYQPYPYNAVDGPENPAGDVSRTLRGGAWDYGVDVVRCAYRRGLTPDNGDNNGGFRILSPSS